MFFFFFNEHRDELRKATESGRAKAIIESEDFYFQKALDKYEEYKKLDVDDTLLSVLIAQTDVKPFSYERMLNGYRQGTKEREVLRVIGELISYIDKNAAMKNTLNEYADKRTMALAFVRQNVWVKYLLKFKQGTSLLDLPEIIQNAIRYIEHPDQEITVFSEQRKKIIFETIFNGEDGNIFTSMKGIGITSKNPLNDGHLYSAILHSENIRTLWEKSKSKEILPEVIEEQKTWSYAPGEDGRKWEEFKKDDIMAIGWDAVGDLARYGSKEEIKTELTRLYGTESTYMNDGHALWQFCNEVQIGDRIFAKAGSKILLGIGEVISDYEYDNNREEYKHLRKVNWIKVGRWELDEKFAIKTLTDITAYEEFCEKVENVANDNIVDVTWEAYTKQDFLKDVFVSEEQYDALRELLIRKKNIILQGAPGVGKTYAAKRLAYSIIEEKDEKRVKLIQFHQSYSYEDFIMGYRPTENGFSIKHGVFYDFCKVAQGNPDKPFFFIIDEINRGNLSKIFGELLMLIEADKRGEKMALVYEDENFFVPENIYIIGMMNTADRSLAIIDYALRRRFCFFELVPAFGSESFREYLIGNNVDEAIVNKIVRSLSYLNSKIENDPNLGSGFRIGHSYFCDCNTADNLWYESIIKYEVAPLLEEYWFDDLETAKDLIEELLR